MTPGVPFNPVPISQLSNEEVLLRFQRSMHMSGYRDAWHEADPRTIVGVWGNQATTYRAEILRRLNALDRLKALPDYVLDDALNDAHFDSYPMSYDMRNKGIRRIKAAILAYLKI